MSELSFEESIEKLEKIVDELENGKLSLNDSIKSFEEGVQLSKHCSEMIDQAEKQISILISQEDGSMKEENFDTKE